MEFNDRIDRPQKPEGSSEKYRVIPNLGYSRFKDMSFAKFEMIQLGLHIVGCYY